MPIVTNGGWLGHTIDDIKKDCSNVTTDLVLQFDGDKLITDSSVIDKFIEEANK